MLNSIQERFEQEIKDIGRRQHNYREHDAEYDALVTDMEAIGVEVTYATSLDFRFTGTKDTLTEVIRVLRRHGYDSTDRPSTEPFATYSAFWHKYDEEKRMDPNYLSVWVWFTSSVCTMKQVGTKTQEVPVYEVVCE